MEIDELAQPSLTSSSSSATHAPATATAAAEAKLSVTELGQGQGQGQGSGMPESLRAMPPSSTSTSSSENCSAAATEVVGAVEEVEEEEEEEEDEEEEEEEDVCRICRNNGEEANPLHYPCACSGSIKYVHQDCLLQWLNHSNTRHCEVCKHPFSFSPVYAENAPTRLPCREFVFGIATKTCRSLHFILRLAFVISVWFVIIPFTTFWIWRLAFIRSFVDAQKLFLSHMSPSPLLQDCFHGLVLSAGIVFIFLGATSLRDYFRYLRELRGHEAGREDEVMDRQQRQARRLQGNRANVDGVNGEAVQEQLLRRNAENVAARLEIQAPPLEPHVEQIFDGVDDADGAEDVPFDELVGMQGPVFHLVENAITVLASNAIFLAVVIFLPFTLGRIVLYLLSRILVSTSSGVVAESIASSVSDLSIANMSLDAVANMSAKVQGSTAISEALINDSLIDVVNESNSAVFFTKGNSIEVLTMAGVTSLQVSDVATLSVGYMVILGLLFSYFAILALIRYNRGEPLTEGRIYGIASMAEAIPSLGRQFLAGVKYFMTMLKVGFLLVVELGVFPLLCGWWLDVCTISMLGTTISQRVAFFWTSPLTSTLLHWFVGILYMLQISIFVSLLRGVLRPGVLYFLRDPADPNYNPFRDLIDDPIHKHARRVLLSSVVYGSLIVMLVFLPVKLAMYLAPTIFPLDTSVSDPFTEIPADMLLFQICIPFAIEHFRPRATIKKILSHWFTVVCWVLGLTDYLLPNPDDDNTQAGEMADQVQQDRVNNVHRDGLGERHFNGLEQNQNLLALPALGDDNRAVGHEDSSSSVDNQELAGDNSSDSEEYMFVIRIVVLLFLAWLTLLSFNSAMIVVPVSLGRALFAAIPRLPITHGIKCNDFYAFNIGCYIIWAAIAGIGYAIDYFKSHNMRALLIQVFKWSSIVVKSSILLSLWIIVIPVLIGLLFDLLVVVPFRVPVNESPVFLLYQDWSFGLVFLKVWTRLVMYGHVGPLFDESWRIKFERVRADGFSRLRGLWVFQEIVAPILMKLLTALCVPYVFARGLFPLFGYSLLINSVVYRFAWLGCLAMGSLWYCMKRFQQWFLNLHNSIRDDRYLIGRRLHNYGERSSSQARSNNNQRTVEVPNSQTSNAEQGSGVEDAGSSSESLGSEIGTSGRQNEVAENLRQRRPRVEIMD